MARLDRRRRGVGLILASVAAVSLGWSRLASVRGDDEKDDGSFGMTAPIVCKEIRGYEDYVPLPDAALTSDEKLLVYILPRHYKSALRGVKFEAHLTQDGRVRRRGEKAVLWSKAKILDYKVATASPPRLIYLRNMISLKGLKPGEYDYDIVLRDEIGRSAPVTRTLPFRVLPATSAGSDEARSPRVPQPRGTNALAVRFPRAIPGRAVFRNPGTRPHTPPMMTSGPRARDS